MKMLLGWLSDPFLHIAVVCVLLFFFLQGGEANTNDSSQTSACRLCHRTHDKTLSCQQVPLSVANH